MGTNDVPADAILRRLTVCLFLHILGGALAMQLYPKVILEFFHDDDGKASRFNGWITLISASVKFFAIPGLSGISDVWGRRGLLAGGLGLHGIAMLGLAFTPSSIIAVAVCQVVTGLCDVVLPVSQAIIVDISRGEGEAKREISHGLGLISAAFGLAVAVGPILGGYLSGGHRQLACLLCVGISMLALTSLWFYGWAETAPKSALQEQAGATVGEKKRNPCGAWRCGNPFSILKVFVGNRLLLLLAQCLFMFSLSLYSYTIWYNYFDYKLHWSALDIAIFLSTFGLILALVTGVILRFLVPVRLGETRAILLGFSLQTLAGILYGLANRGWMVYGTLFLTALIPITEPCIQSIMAKLVDANLQGSLQGAVMSLRLLSQGIAGPVYGHIFFFSVSDTMKNAIGTKLPGLPMFLASVVGLTAGVMVWCSLESVQEAIMTAADEDTGLTEDEGKSLNGTPPVDVQVCDEAWSTSSLTTMNGALPASEKDALMQEPLLSSPASSLKDFDVGAASGL